MFKKSFSIIALLFTITFLAGCANQPPSFEDRIQHYSNLEFETTELSGVIHELAQFDFYQSGTHELKTQDGDLFLIQSQTVNLNRYIDKTVTLTGEVINQKNNAKAVFNVMQVELEIDGENGDLKTYENQTVGLAFTYPPHWELVDGGSELTLFESGQTLIEINSFSTTNAAHFANENEEGEADEVTVGAQKSFRYTTDSELRFYVPNPSKGKVYQIIFTKGDDEEKETAFYNWLDSVTPLYFQKPTGKRCGGPAKLTCDEGFRCELGSADENATGVCIPLSQVSTGEACPFIPKPTDCEEFQIADFTTSGCPSRYECVTETAAEVSAINPQKVIETVVKYQVSLFDGQPDSLDDFEVDSENKLITVTYKKDGKTQKTTFSFTPSGNEFNFIPQAEEAIETLKVETETSSNVEPKEVIPPKLEGMRAYENSVHEFTIFYPKNWYFRSFGGIENTLWLVGFADGELDTPNDALITLRLLKNKPASGSDYQVSVLKNDIYFVLQGSPEFKEVMEAMVDSIES